MTETQHNLTPDGRQVERALTEGSCASVREAADVVQAVGRKVTVVDEEDVHAG